MSSNLTIEREKLCESLQKAASSQVEVSIRVAWLLSMRRGPTLQVLLLVCNGYRSTTNCLTSSSSDLGGKRRSAVASD